MKHLTKHDLCMLHNLCVDAINFWENVSQNIPAESRNQQINYYKGLIDRLEEEGKTL